MNPCAWLGPDIADDPSRAPWEDGERRFCKVICRGADGNEEPCFAVFHVAEHPTPASAARFMHEFAQRELLDDAWALHPLELRQAHGRQAMLLRYQEGEPLERLLGTPMETGTFLRIGIALADALRCVHERGLVHRDVKPANILVDVPGGRARFTGFGIASRLQRERPAPELPQALVGTLSHMSPEQTGRMNRSVDSRSDLYGLGVTLYQMATGGLPFNAPDAMGWLHCHVAKRPQPAHLRCGEVAPQVSSIIARLLAKAPEDRYQTAAGVQRDLRRCLDAWRARHEIDEFAPGMQDRLGWLAVPEQLYGRDGEIAALQRCFDDVALGGRPRLVLVRGHSGIGKSALVNELHTVLLPSRGLFASGKFDPRRRDAPHATLVQAFQGLVHGLLGMPEAELAPWRDELARALGANAALLVEHVPELAFILGEQPHAPDVSVSVSEAKARFHAVVQRFVGVFARAAHPLALFLDDLQWIDPATLDLLDVLLEQGGPGHLLVVGACRDNEVDDAHPLARKLQALRAAGHGIEEIVLGPLDEGAVARLCADALCSDLASTWPLARLVHHKTLGNPFFVSRFLQALAEDGEISFDPGAQAWTWDLPSIRGRGYAENVMELMAHKLGQLPPATRRALEALACLGDSAPASTLALVTASSERALHADLSDAHRADLVVRSADAYRFAHDRVREAAYALVPEAMREEAHLRMGRRLLADPSPARREESLFDIVGQLNRGAALVVDLSERDELASLNLAAGRRARSTGAAQSALGFFDAGTSMLSEDAWDRRHDLAFALELERGNAVFEAEGADAALPLFSALQSRAVGVAELAVAAADVASMYYCLGRPELAIANSLDCLRRAGVDIAPHPSEAMARAAWERMRARVGGRRIGELIDLPTMRDPAARAMMELLRGMIPSAHGTDRNLLVVVVCASVELSLEHGHCDASCYAYQYVSAVPGWPANDFEIGFDFGRLGRDLVEREGLQRYRENVLYLFALRVLPWGSHVASCRDLFVAISDLVAAKGNRPMAGPLTWARLSNELLGHVELRAVEQHAERGEQEARRASAMSFIADMIGTQAALARSLRGQTARLGSLDDERFDERRMEALFAGGQQMAAVQFTYWVRKLQARELADDHAGALEASAQAEGLRSTSSAVLETAEFAFYTGLAHAGAWGDAAAGGRPRHVARLVELQAEIAETARHCPENFQYRAVLLAAEIARIEGRDAEAMHLYEMAIDGARDQGFMSGEGIAAERAAAFHSARGHARIARAYLRDARHAHVRWGADGKVRQLDERHPGLRAEGTQGEAQTIETPIEQLELATVLAVLEAISGETDLEALVARIMRIALEHAGAERGVLMRPRDESWVIEAEAGIAGDGVAVDFRQADVTPADLPGSALRYLLRTKEPLCLCDASAELPFAADEYVRARRARSVLCMPLLKQSRLVGALYLENNLSPGVFTPVRMSVLRLLASEAAISLENARLYRDLQEREQGNRNLQMRLAEANRVASIGLLSASIAHEINQPLCGITINVGTCLRVLDADPPDAEAAGQSARRVLRDANRASEVVARLRSLFVTGAPAAQPMDLDAAAHEVIDLFAAELRAADVSLQWALAGDLPLVPGDRVQLQQVILNLVRNAADAMTGVEDRPRQVTIRTQSDDEGVQLAVQDNGSGLDPAHGDKVFDALFTTKRGGMGIGLSVSRSIIERHGGRLWATANEAAPGATFSFVVPHAAAGA